MDFVRSDFLKKSYFNIFHFKAFGMINLHYEIRICQKIYNKVTTTVYVKCEVQFNMHKTLPAGTNIVYSLSVKLHFLSWVNRIPVMSMLPCVNMRDHASRSFLFLSFFIKIGSRDLIISLFCFLP